MGEGKELNSGEGVLKVPHDGDCSIFRYNRKICDCGALRKKARVHLEEVETEWANHINSLSQLEGERVN